MISHYGGVCSIQSLNTVLPLEIVQALASDKHQQRCFFLVYSSSTWGYRVCTSPQSSNYPVPDRWQADFRGCRLFQYTTVLPILKIILFLAGGPTLAIYSGGYTDLTNEDGDARSATRSCTYDRTTVNAFSPLPAGYQNIKVKRWQCISNTVFRLTWWTPWRLLKSSHSVYPAP